MNVGTVLERHGGIVHRRGARRPARRRSSRAGARSRSCRRCGRGGRRGRARTKSGIHHSPVPSWPVASTSLRAASTSPVDRVTSRQLPPSSSRPARWPWPPRRCAPAGRVRGDTIAGSRASPARDEVQVGEAAGPVQRVVPGLEGEARDAEIGPGLILGAAQGRHAGEGRPTALPGRRAHDRSAGCCAPDRASAQSRCTRPDWPAPTISTSSAGVPWNRRGLHPLGARMRRHLEVPLYPGFEGREIARRHDITPSSRAPYAADRNRAPHPGAYACRPPAASGRSTGSARLPRPCRPAALPDRRTSCAPRSGRG